MKTNTCTFFYSYSEVQIRIHQKPQKVLTQCKSMCVVWRERVWVCACVLHLYMSPPHPTPSGGIACRHHSTPTPCTRRVCASTTCWATPPRRAPAPLHTGLALVLACRSGATSTPRRGSAAAVCGGVAQCSLPMARHRNRIASAVPRHHLHRTLWCRARLFQRVESFDTAVPGFYAVQQIRVGPLSSVE